MTYAHLAVALSLSAATAVAAAPASVVVVVTEVGAPPAAPPPATPSPARAEAQQLMTQRCALCHGASGRADGPMSKTLNPKPRAFADPAWQASIDDAHISRIIVAGGPSVGKSPIMPANPDLEDKAPVVAELVKIVRGFRLRGVVRAQLTAADGTEVGNGEAAPDDAGKGARVTLPAPPPGSYTLRAWLDANQDGKRDNGERVAEVALEVTEAGAEAQLKLAPPAPTAPAAAPRP